MNLATRGLGRPGGLLASAGMGRAVFPVEPPEEPGELTGGPSGPEGVMRRRRGKVRRKSAAWGVMFAPEQYAGTVIGLDPEHELELVPPEAVPTIEQELKERATEPAVAAVQAELGVDRDAAVTAMRQRLEREIAGFEALRLALLDDEELALLLIVAHSE